jgi:hypothetical protein
MATTNPPGGITPAQFIAKWERVTLPERAASQEHFIDLCRLLCQPTPAEHDATGAEYAFEKGVAVTNGASRGSKGDSGYADVWWRGKFGWEYKRKDKYKDLTDAYRQLCQYREALDNPPLLVVSDITRTEIHTNFTGTAKHVHTVLLADLAAPENLSLLRRVFTDPESFRPTITVQKVTEQIAEQIGDLAKSLHARGHDPHAAAHFLMKCMFGLFAEDVGLLSNGLFSRILDTWHDQPAELQRRLSELFAAMCRGGAFGADPIPWFNGGLFDETPPIELTTIEIEVLRAAARQDWAAVEPAIFGTLFERSLDPDKRAQIGAHYTSRADILLIVEPVVMAPLRRQWAEVQAKVEDLLASRHEAKTAAAKRKADKAIDAAIQDFLHHMATRRILDPACGSGNFLYVAIQQLLELEKEVITFAARPDIGQGLFPQVRPTQLHGLELNPYAAELAQVVIWIGYLQWMRDNGFNAPRNPILEPLQSIECRDAILDLPATSRDLVAAGGAQTPSPNVLTTPALWPEADFIIGNPPFLGSKLLRLSGLTDDYVAAMYAAYDLPKCSDLCCYWFEQARRMIEKHPATRVGLLATQGIRGSDNRTVLERIKKTGDIFMAWSDRDWILDGANVHVSMVGFDNGAQAERVLDGQAVAKVNANLRPGADTGEALQLKENAVVGWSIGTQKGGPFEFGFQVAREMLKAPSPNGRPNLDVVRPWRNGSDLVGRLRGLWIVDFGPAMTLVEASGYEQPFEYVRRLVKPERDSNRRDSYREKWWIHQEARGELRDVLETPLVLLTPRVSKHRLWVRSDSTILPDCQVIVFARGDDYFFGVLHSSIQEMWALRMGTQLEDRPRYTPTTCFETFALPWAPGKEPADGLLCVRIAEAARHLNEQRERWLNPPEWINAIAAAVDHEDSFPDVPEAARPLIRQSAIMDRAAKHPELKRRTLTALYNERPTWLRLAHQELDRAVLAAYAATDPAGGWPEDWAEVWADTGAGQTLPPNHPLAARRSEIDARVLENLLRLNQARV